MNNNRRMFFRKFLGNVGMFLEEASGAEFFPLNRLKELPEDIIEQIEPVFFPEEKWSVEKNILLIPEHKYSKEIKIELNNIELQALEIFKKSISLKNTAIEIKTNYGSDLDEIYKTVTNLFFKLASLRICHPKKTYNLDEILKTGK